MPKIEIERLSRGVGTPSQTGQPRASAAGTEVSQSLGRALSQQGQQLTNTGLEISQDIKVARDLEYVTSSMTTANEEAIRFEKKFKESMAENPAGYADAYIGEIDSIYDGYIQGAPSQEAKSQLQQMFSAKRNNQFKGAFNFEANATKAKVISSAEENLNLITNRLIEDPSLLPESQQEIDMMMKSINSSLDPDKALQFKSIASEQLSRSVITGLVNQGKYDDAKAFLTNDNIKSILTPNEIARLEKSIDSDMQAQMEAAQKQDTIEYKKFIDDTKTMIIKGELSEVQLENMFNEGNFRSAQDFINVSNTLNRFRKDQSSISNAVTEVGQALDGGIPLDPSLKDNRRKADSYYNEVILKNTAPEELGQKTEQFINSIGVVPEGIKNNIISKMHNGDPKTAVASASTINNLVDSNLRLSRNFSNKDLAKARRMSKGFSAGLSEEEILKIERERERLSDQTYNLRVNALNDLNPTFDHGEITEWFADDPNEVPEEMEAEWNMLVDNYALDLGADPEDAVDLAYKTLQTKWHKSDILGDLRYIKNAPEVYYSVPGVDNEWMQKQLNQDLASFGQLNISGITADPQSNPQQPEYFIDILVDGIPTQLTNEDGSLIVWSPSWDEWKTQGNN